MLEVLEVREFLEYHEEFVLTGPGRVTSTNEHERLVMGMQVHLHQKLQRPESGTVGLLYGSGMTKRLDYPVSAFTHDAVAARYARFKHALRAALPDTDLEKWGTIDTFNGIRRLLEADDKVFVPLFFNAGDRLQIEAKDIAPPDVLRVTLHGYQKRPVV